MFKFLKKEKCDHLYLETDLEIYDVWNGGKRLFLCINCAKQDYIYIPSIENIYKQQRIAKEFGFTTKPRYIKSREELLL